MALKIESLADGVSQSTRDEFGLYWFDVSWSLKPVMSICFSHYDCCMPFDSLMASVCRVMFQQVSAPEHMAHSFPMSIFHQIPVESLCGWHLAVLD